MPLKRVPPVEIFFLKKALDLLYKQSYTIETSLVEKKESQ